MNRLQRVVSNPSRWFAAGAALVLCVQGWLCPVAQAGPEAAPSKQTGKAATSAEWQNTASGSLKPGEIDRLIATELRVNNVKPAPRTSDEQFLRRVTLDLTGELPEPADLSEFLADKDPNKRAKVIDKLLATEEYARHWANYWRDVLVNVSADQRNRAMAQMAEPWLAEQFRKNRSWGEVVRDLLTAGGEVRFREPDKNGSAFFLAAFRGAEAASERAALASRVFLGIQIQCAQCHDHPSDVWKRNQFHEFAAYFARMREQPLRDGNMILGVALVSRPGGEHEMPGKDDPRRGTVTHPRFLDGQSPGRGLGDKERRQALADQLVDKNNFWFSAAFVNRVWGELMGQSFYQPVDNLGPEKAAIYPAVIARLAASFRDSEYDVKALFRAVLTSETYQRQTRLGESADEHLLFAASYPTRLRADALWQSLVNVLGSFSGPREMGPRPGGGPFAQRGGFEFLFKEEFKFDPSLKADEVEGSISQALLMMNSPVIHQRVQARGTNLLARILSAYPKDDDAIRQVYLKALARKPTNRELERSREYAKKVGNRAEAFEDLLWALLNSTEFQTKR